MDYEEMRYFKTNREKKSVLSFFFIELDESIMNITIKLIP